MSDEFDPTQESDLERDLRASLEEAKEPTQEDIEAAAAVSDRATKAGIPPLPVTDEEAPPDPTPLTDRMHGPRGTPHRDEWDAEQRRLAIESTMKLEGMPAYQNFAQAEAEFEQNKIAYREAFLKEHRKKEKKA